MDSVLALIGDDLKNVEKQFKKDLESNVPLIRKVGEYVLSSGGKRIRPALLLLAAKLWGNEASVLVGDFLFSKSFSLMVADGDLNVLRVLSNATTRIAEGEVMQLICTSDVDITEERYIEVVVCKTAVLLSAACQAGAIIGGVSAEHE